MPLNRYLIALCALSLTHCASNVGTLRSQFSEEDLAPSSEAIEQWPTTTNSDTLEAIDLSKKPRSLKWWRDYRLALITRESTPDKSCQLFQNLAIEKNFPIQEYAHQRAQQVCLQTQKDKEIEQDSPSIATASELQNRREYKKAVQIYRKIIQLPDGSFKIKREAFEGLRKTYKLMQNTPAYIKATQEAFTFTKKQLQMASENAEITERAKEYNQTLSNLVKALWTDHQRDAALSALLRNMDLILKQTACDNLYFLAGRIYEEKGETTKARAFYKKSLNQELQTPRLKEKILWSLGWSLYKEQHYQEALEYFLQLEETSNENSEKSKALYWRARSLENLHKLEESSSLYASLIQKDNLGFYGLLAHRQMRRPIPNIWFQKLPLKDANKSALRNLVDEFSMAKALKAEWLIAVEERIFAESLLREIVNAILENPNTTFLQKLNLFKFLSQSGYYLPIFGTLSSLPVKERSELLQQFPQIIFPTAHLSTITEAAVSTNLPPELILSIIRQESSFNPNARSSADALGLMQLIPSVAAQLARNLKGPNQYKTPEDLLKPPISIYLGAEELKRLMKKYENQFILAIGSYNANPAAVNRWWKERYRMDPIEFIEEIPYDETRNYIKLVLRNFVFYYGLNEKNLEEFIFPDFLLKLSDPHS